MKKGTQSDFIRTALRLPPDLHARIHESAAKHRRTFNGEIVDRLQATFETIELNTTRAQDNLLATWSVIHSFYLDTQRHLAEEESAANPDLEEVAALKRTITAVHDELLKIESDPKFPPFVRRATSGSMPARPTKRSKK